MRELSFVKNTLEGMVHPIPDKRHFFFVDNPRHLFVKLMTEIYLSHKSGRIQDPYRTENAQA
jgi:hypothetical protein